VNNDQLNAADVIVIGGGPAGATCATILADYGRDVLLLEKDAYPRHHIGESLMPQTFLTFERLGVLDKLRESDCPIKESVQFVSSSGKDSLPYFFTDRDPRQWSRTWQVRRDRFDAMMLDNARQHGVRVRQNIGVRRVIFDGERAAGVVARLDGDPGKDVELRAAVVVDATGLNSLLARQLGLVRGDPQLQNAAFYSYFKGAQRDEGRNGGATLIVDTPGREGWFWFIPLADGVTSVGVVAPPGYLCSGRGGDPEQVLAEEIERCPGARRRLEHAERVDKVRVCRDFSYRASRIAGDGWLLVGDAFGFLDPVYSSGLMLALRSGEWAADAIHSAFEADDLSGERLGRFGPKLARGMHLLRQLVYAFYDKEFSFGAFMRAHPEYKDHLVRLLIGDVFNDEVAEIFEVMRTWTTLPEAIPLEGSTPAQ